MDDSTKFLFNEMDVLEALAREPDRALALLARVAGGAAVTSTAASPGDPARGMTVCHPMKVWVVKEWPGSYVHEGGGHPRLAGLFATREAALAIYPEARPADDPSADTLILSEEEVCT